MAFGREQFPNEPRGMEEENSQESPETVANRELVSSIRKLQRQRSSMSELLSEICATFSIEANRKEIEKIGIAGKELLKIADCWIGKFKEICEPNDE